MNLSFINKQIEALRQKGTEPGGLTQAEQERLELLHKGLELAGSEAVVEVIDPEGKVRVRMEDGERVADQQIDRIDDGMFVARLDSPALIGGREVVLVESAPGRPVLVAHAVALAPSSIDPSLISFRLEKG